MRTEEKTEHHRNVGPGPGRSEDTEKLLGSDVGSLRMSQPGHAGGQVGTGNSLGLGLKNAVPSTDDCQGWREVLLIWSSCALDL